MNRLQIVFLTRDPGLFAVLRPAMESLGVHCEIETQAAALLGRLASRHLDGVVIDCDGVDGATGLLPLIRAGSCNQLSTIIAIVDGKTGVNQAMSLGASFVLSKPVSPLRLQPYLKTLLGPMEREHWRYFRHRVDLPIILVRSEDQPLAARTVNVSESGLALRCNDQGSLDSSFLLKLQLPYRERGIIEIKGDTIWADAQGLVGIHFRNIARPSRPRFDEWMKELRCKAKESLSPSLLGRVASATN